MSISKRYNVAPDTVKQMVKDGVIPGSVARHYELYEQFLSLKAANPTKSNRVIFMDMADEHHISFAAIDKIVYALHKK